MNRNDRVKEVMRYYKLNKNRFSQEIGLKNNATIGRIINEGNNPSEKTVRRIITRFSDISYEWLMDGEGSMFVDHKSMPEDILADEMIDKLIDKLLPRIDKRVLSQIDEELVPINESLYSLLLKVTKLQKELIEIKQEKKSSNGD